MTAYEALTQKYALEASLTELRFRKEELKKTIPELKFGKRQAEEEQIAASTGFQKLWNRMLGKGEERQEDADRAVRRAAAALEEAQRDLRIVEEKIASAERENADLGEKQSLMTQLTPEERTHFQHLEASLGAEAALYYLHQCRKELTAAQEYARNPMMAVGDGYQENIHKANAGKWADKCREQLLRIRANGIDITMHPYLEKPMGYIVTAMPYGDQDRMNSAQAGIRETEKLLKELLLQLAQ